jgi:hypothetical protein
MTGRQVLALAYLLRKSIFEPSLSLVASVYPDVAHLDSLRGFVPDLALVGDGLGRRCPALTGSYDGLLSH